VKAIAETNTSDNPAPLRSALSSSENAYWKNGGPGGSDAGGVAPASANDSNSARVKVSGSESQVASASRPPDRREVGHVRHPERRDRRVE
jgi:hypothetical protein